MDKIKLAIGTIILCIVVSGYTAYSDYQLNHSPKSGTLIENNIEPPDFDDVFTPAKGK
jgi:hypothetical protein